MRKFLILSVILLLCSCKKENEQYNGYIDADLTYLSSNYPGRLAELCVKRGQSVLKHQLLFKLEQTSEAYAIKNSLYQQSALLAQRKEVLAQLQYAEINYQRTQQMKKNHVASQNDLDVARKELKVLKNQLTALDAQIKSSQVDTENKQWDASRKESTAPDAGIIFDTYFTKDEYVQGGQPVLSLITQSHIKAVFFVPETELAKIHLNSKVKLSSDGNPNLATGHIQYISNIAQYTPPLIYSREERQDLVFRVEVGIDSPNLNQIHLGQPVTLEWHA